MNYNTQEISNIIRSLTKTDCDVFTIKDNLFYKDIYISCNAYDYTLSRLISHKKELELYLQTKIDITTDRGFIIARIQTENRPTEKTFDYLIPEKMQNNLDYELPLIIGMDETGKRMYFDLVKAPHILVGGTTGSGKSVFLNNCIISSIYTAKSALILIDVKQVEFSIYENIPALAHPIIYDVKTARNVLKGLCNEMENRYKTLKDYNVRSIQEYNQRSKNQMQYITIIIDELADLFIQDKRIESLVVRIAQLGRAAGIHLILATQRPDSNILSGLVRSNMPTRICFAVQKATDSRIILDESGGQNLKGQGDGLLKPIGSKTMIHFQAPYIDIDDITKIVERVKEI